MGSDITNFLEDTTIFGMGKKEGGVKAAPTMTYLQRQQLFDPFIRLLSEQLGQGVEPYPGAWASGASPLQQQAFDMYGNAPGQAGQMMSMGLGGMENIMAPWDPAGAQNMWQQSMVDPAMNVWEQQMVPDIMGKFGAADSARSSGMQNAIARSGENLATNLGGQLSNLLYSGQQAHMGRQLQAMPELYRMGMMPFDVAGQMLGAGGAQYGISEAQRGAEQAKWTAGQPYASPWMNFLGMGLGTQAFQPYYQQGTPGLGYQMLPGLGQAAGMAMGAGMFPTAAGAQVGSPMTIAAGGGGGGGAAPPLTAYPNLQWPGASGASTAPPLTAYPGIGWPW